MQFFFVPDYHSNLRFISSEPVQQIQVEFSRLKKLWTAAKEKLLLLPPRILRQEQAFARISNLSDESIQIQYSGMLQENKISKKFFFFLQKQRTKHVLLLLLEVILLPISGLMMILPGPNVFFGVLALIMITHWQALQGINALRKKHLQFIASPTFKKWELAVAEKNENEYAAILELIKLEYKLKNINKVLYK